VILDPQGQDRGALYRFLITVIVPRPIAFVSTRGRDGVSNVAPFSYFTAISDTPPYVGVSIGDRAGDPKDTLRNIRDTGEFVINIVNEPMMDAMIRTSGNWPANVSEFGVTGLTEKPSTRVQAPGVAESPVQLECRFVQEMALGSSFFVVGEVVFAQVRDEVLTNGIVDPLKLLPVGRLGGDLLSLTREVAARPRPRVSRSTGLEG
jgi:flavin reductase (DIM6/NTAB) family NADH-FMN oxidoreductase RutF